MMTKADERRRHVVITGASGGLGRALSAQFAAPDVTLGLHYAGNEEGVRAAVREAGAQGAGTYMLRADFGLRDSVGPCVQAIAQRGARVDALVLNAGAVHEAPLVRTGAADWDRMVAINLRAPAKLVELLFEEGLLQDGSHVVAIGSLVGLRGQAGLAAYAAAKAGLAGYVRDAAVRFGGRGVCVNAVVPGILETGMTAGIGRNAFARMCAENALGRPTTCAEVARAVQVLTALADVSGQVIALDSRPWPEPAHILRPRPEAD
jgi:3-oxoacyl-[acyl-carrier protein] reductase